ncbi:quinolinate synthase NadA [Anaerotalea alkaliphila]|uniref:Quinolinate synthase n=1 Tax=Anaerotalea alkaliphila TaxID=2662126 RepID=A0A7X5HXP5_9FIRM|nr:quinolinate synthase NadA [Anaerotalea alkaliphila]NDL68426.1 quinolinate synthase NadA [Anaerotalea alkaliphila]
MVGFDPKTADKETLTAEINRLKKEKNAVIVAHYYQQDEVQEIADVVGDSFALSKYCANNDADVIVFCGVHFMAESAKILSPEKTVYLAEARSGCPMADMVTADDVKRLRREHPEAAVVCYVNSSAETKAECDVCCTSSNAVQIVRALEQKEVLFIPDKNLGSYVASQVPEKTVIPYEGFCYTHNKITVEEVDEVMALHPDAELAVHPECRGEILDRADFVGSTAQIIDHCTKSDSRTFIIGTEMGVLYELKKRNPDKKFYLLTPRFVCPNMKHTRLYSVYNALAKGQYEIEVDEDIRVRALGSLERMLELGN